jgi:hypothetical protein
MLERANILTWVNRIIRVQASEGCRILRTSNAYIFRDPLPCAAAKSEIQTETSHPVSLLRPIVVDEALRASLLRFELAFRTKKRDT